MLSARVKEVKDITYQYSKKNTRFHNKYHLQIRWKTYALQMRKLVVLK